MKYSESGKMFRRASDPELVPPLFRGKVLSDVWDVPWKKEIENYVYNFREISQKEGRSAGLYIYGPNNTGKSIALYAMFNEIKKMGLPATIVNSADIMNAIRITSGPMPFKIKTDFDEERGGDNVDDRDPANMWANSFGFLEDLKNVEGFLFIDDAGCEKMTDYSVAKYYEIINGRYVNNAPTIYTSNFSLKELESVFFQRICSRIDRTCKLINVTNNE